MLMSLVEVGVPFKLLRRENYHKYWKERCEPTQTIPHRTHSYKASVWQIHAVIFQVLMIRLLGARRCTRYIWSMTTCGMFWLDLAEHLIDTARNLFGCDGMEILNDKIKETLRMNTNKFGVANKDLLTLIRVLRWSLWDHYHFREENPLIDTERGQEQSLKKQSLRDSHTLSASDRLQEFFAKNNVDYLPSDQFLINDVHRFKLSEQLLVTDDHIQDLTELRPDGGVQPSDDNEDDDLFVDNFGEDYAVHDSRQNADEEKDPDTDDDDDLEAKTFDSNRVAAIYVATTQRLFKRNDSKFDFDPLGYWKSLKFVIDQPCRLFLGASRIVIEGHFLNKERNAIYLRFEWSYAQLFAIHFHFETARNAVYFKFTTMPVTKIKASGSTEWAQCTDIPCRAAQKLSSSGLIRVDIDAAMGVTAELMHTARCHPTIRIAQIKSRIDFCKLEADFCATEKQHAAALFDKPTYPINGVHSLIAKGLDAHFKDLETGRRDKQCANCDKMVRGYEAHAICVSTADETRNVASSLLGRLGCERNVVQPAQFVVEQTSDPAHRGDDGATMFAAQNVIETCPLLWVPFMLSVYARILSVVMKIRESAIQRCKRDNDWKRLNLRPIWLLKQMDAAMKETLSTLDCKVPFTDRAGFVKDMFRAVSGIWKITINYYEATMDAAQSGRGMRTTHYSQQIHWNTRLNYSEYSYCNDEQFAEWGVAAASVILNDYRHPTCAAEEFKFTFWRKLESECI